MASTGLPNSASFIARQLECSLLKMSPESKHSSSIFLNDLNTPPLTPDSSRSNSVSPGLEEPFTFNHLGQHECLTRKDLESPTVAVLGVGYVGHHLVEGFGSQYPVIAFDISQNRLDTIKPSLAHIPDLILTTNTSKLALATHYLVSVPTVLRPDRSIDTRHIEAALATVASVARPGSVVVVESSVAVGMTRTLLKELIETKGVHGGMSPERVDPGRTFPALEAVPKIISGMTETALNEIEKLYTRVFDTLVKVSSPEVAEMTKLYENCQRMINIAYANEMADAAYSIGLDPYEVAAAAATKPFGYSPFSPSLGVGGACIPCNPAYLLSNLNFPLLRQATQMTWDRPANAARNLLDTKDKLIPLEERKVLVVGMGFKPGQSVLIHSPGLAFAKEAKILGVNVAWVDPLVEQDALPDILKYNDGSHWTVEELEENFDTIVISHKQTGLDFGIFTKLESRAKVEVIWRTEKPQVV